MVAMFVKTISLLELSATTLNLISIDLLSSFSPSNGFKPNKYACNPVIAAGGNLDIVIVFFSLFILYIYSLPSNSSAVYSPEVLASINSGFDFTSNSNP